MKIAILLPPGIAVCSDNATNSTVRNFKSETVFQSEAVIARKNKLLQSMKTALDVRLPWLMDGINEVKMTR